MAILIDILKIAVLNSFVIAVLFLINRSGNIRANRCYGFLVLILSAVVYEHQLILSGDIFAIPHTCSLATSLLMLLPPIFYLLHLFLLSPEHKVSPRSLILHGLPFLLCILALLPFFQLSGDQKSEIIRQIYWEGEGLEWPYVLFSAVNLLQFFVYMILTLKSLRARGRQNAKKSIRINLSWFNRLVLAMNAIIFLYLLLYASLVFGPGNRSTLVLIFMVLILVAIYSSSILLIRNPFFFAKHQSIYRGSTLTSDIIDLLSKQMENVLTEQQPYLTPRLKLADLATLLEVSTHQLSQYLNQIREESFSQLINSRRIAHAKQLLEQDLSRQQTILGIALDSGFSSQAHFIKVFKEATSYTPSHYRKLYIKTSVFDKKE